MKLLEVCDVRSSTSSLVGKNLSEDANTPKSTVASTVIAFLRLVLQYGYDNMKFSLNRSGADYVDTVSTNLETILNYHCEN